MMLLNLTKLLASLNILKETCNKIGACVTGIDPLLCLHFAVYNMRLVNTFIIVMYDVINYSLLVPNLVAFYVQLNEI